MASNPFDYAERFNRPRREQSTQIPADPLAAEIERMREEQVRDTFAVLPQPDQVARVTKLAREADVPPLYVEDDPDGTERDLAARRFVDLTKRYPAIGKFAVINPRGAAAAQDDAPALSRMGQAFDGLKRLGKAAVGQLDAGRLWTSGIVWDTLATADEAVTTLTYPVAAARATAASAFGINDDPDKRARERRRFLRGASSQMETARNERSQRDRFGNYWVDSTLAGLQSAPAMVVGAALRNPNAAAAALGVGTSAQGYQSALRSGASKGAAIRYGVTTGAAEGLLEKMPISRLGEAIARKTPWGKSFVRQLVTEMPAEQVTTVLQDLSAYAYLPENQGKTFGDYLAERPQAALDTALATTGGVAASTGTVRAAQGATDVTARVVDRIGQATQAKAERQFIDRAEKAATESKLRARDPEAFRSMLREQAEDAGARNVFIPAEAIRAYQQSDSYDQDFDPFDQEAFSEALATGGDYVMPIEDALTDLVGTPAWEAIKDDLRLTGGGMSTREAQTFEEAMDDLVAEMSDQAAEQERAEAPRRDQREQLIDYFTGQFGQSYTAPVARKFAEVMVQRAMTRAERMGMDLEDALAGVSVRQVLPEGVAEAVKADQLDLVINAMRQGKPAEVGEGESLLEFIRLRGGINDTGGDLQAMGLPRRFLRELQRERLEIGDGDNGADSLLREAIGAGFFPDLVNVENEAGPSALDSQVLLDAIGRELAGEPVYRSTRTDPYRQAGEELRGILSDAGLDPETASDREIRDAVARFEAQDDGGRSLEQTDPFGANDNADGGDTLNSLVNFLTDGRPLSVIYDVGDVLLDNGRVGEVTVANDQSLTLTYRDNGSAAIISRTKAGVEPASREFWQEARGRIVFDGAKRTIELFQSRNLSTALHEMSHMWLEELMFDAAQPDAPEQLKADAEAVKAYFAANGHKIDGGFIPTEAHELWARSGERYFMEGKAPSTALVRLFESFRAWLIGIYKTVDRLRAPITPEIREVFDRLIATDEEIAAAQERQALGQLFKDAATIGMSDAEFSAYQQQVDDARAGAHASLIDKTMKAVRRRETERYRKARKGVVAEEQERIDASPLFRAIAMMRDTRISKEWIEDTLGLDALGLLPVRVPPLYVESGTDPQVIAELAGYANARDMIEALIGAERAHRQAKEGGDKRSMRQRAIDTAADAEMLRRYGDPLNDGSIEREALAAVHSEMQGEVIASELRVLSRRTGNRPTPYRIARDWARAKVRQGIVADEASAGAIQRYARNAAKAGRAAEEAMLKQDVGEAFRQKQFQMMNNALLAEAKEAADEVEAAVKRMDKIARARTRKSVDQDYLEQAQALLEAVDLRRRSQVSIKRRGAWEAWAEARQAEGIDVITPKSFEAQLGTTNWTRLPVETLLTLDEQVKQIMHLGRMKQTLLDNAEQRAFEEVVAEAEAAGDNIGRKPPKGSFEDPSWWESTKARMHAFDAALLRMEAVFDWLDNGNSDGVFNRVVFRPIADAQAEQRAKLEEYHTKLKEAARKLPEATVRSWADKVTLDLIDPETGLPASFQRKKIVAMALNWGNAGNRQRLVDGYGWNAAAVERALMDTLTEPEWRYVQEVWDIIGGLWPDIEKMERAINGVAPEKVEAAEVVTPFGTFAGGYYPAIYDSRLDYTAEERQAAKSDLFSANYIRATTRASATKDRAEAVSRPILLDLGVINRHLGEVIHDVTHRAPVMQAHKFLNDRRVKRMIDETLGPEIRKQMQPWLNYVANSWAAERAGNEGVGAFMAKLRANVTVVGMGWRFTTMLTQIAGYSNSFEYVGAQWVAPQIAKFQAQMAGSVGKLATFQGVQMPEMMAFALSKSKELPFRLDTLDRDIRLEMDRLQSKGGKAREGLTAAKRFAFHGIGYMDHLVSIPTWMGAYNKAIDAGLDDAAAVFAADKAIRLSQGAGSPKDLAAVSRGTGRWGEALKLLTMFYTYLSSVYSRQRSLMRDVRRAGAGDIPSLMARAWWLVVVPPLLAELLSGRGPEEDEEWGWWAFQKMLSQSLGAIPIVRDLTDPVFDGFAGRPGFDYRLSPAAGVGSSAVNVSRDIGKIIEGEETKRATRNALEFVGYTTGMVPGQFAASAQFLVDVGAGDAEPENLSDWYTGITKGKLPEE